MILESWMYISAVKIYIEIPLDLKWISISLFWTFPSNLKIRVDMAY